MTVPLPMVEDYQPPRARLIRLNASQAGHSTDIWIPVGDVENRWVQVKDTDGRRGRTHEEAHGNKPTWGQVQIRTTCSCMDEYA